MEMNVELIHKTIEDFVIYLHITKRSSITWMTRNKSLLTLLCLFLPKAQRNLKLKIESQRRFLERSISEKQFGATTFRPMTPLPSLSDETVSNSKGSESDPEEFTRRAAKRARVDGNMVVPHHLYTPEMAMFFAKDPMATYDPSHNGYGFDCELSFPLAWSSLGVCPSPLVPGYI